LLSGCGSSNTVPSAPSTSGPAASATVTSPTATTVGASKTSVAQTTSVTATHAATAPPANASQPGPAPGSLPQTSQLPSSATSAFRADMHALWTGIRNDSPSAAMPAFFPEGAYAQLKAIGDATGDYENRLVADYKLDIDAAHALLGAHASQARLIDVKVPGSYAHWVDPGVCYNRVGYYEVPNSRVVYSEDGVVRSFGIASMISWRGAWYVVHLGTILRGAAAGVVDDPSSGAGSSAPSSTC
jgi:hypothetical protein